jgi:hypothetical protein
MTINGLGELAPFYKKYRTTKMEKNNNKNINVIPRVHYSNADLNKNEAIYEENRGKSGIYR